MQQAAEAEENMRREAADLGGRRGLSRYAKVRLLTPAGQALATGAAAACTPPLHEK